MAVRPTIYKLKRYAKLLKISYDEDIEYKELEKKVLDAIEDWEDVTTLSYILMAYYNTHPLVCGVEFEGDEGIGDSPEDVERIIEKEQDIGKEMLSIDRNLFISLRKAERLEREEKIRKRLKGKTIFGHGLLSEGGRIDELIYKRGVRRISDLMRITGLSRERVMRHLRHLAYKHECIIEIDKEDFFPYKKKDKIKNIKFPF